MWASQNKKEQGPFFKIPENILGPQSDFWSSNIALESPT